MHWHASSEIFDWDQFHILKMSLTADVRFRWVALVLDEHMTPDGHADSDRYLEPARTKMVVGTWKFTR